MKRIIRERRLTDEEAAKYQTVREQVAAELPELVARHHERVAASDKADHEITPRSHEDHGGDIGANSP